MKTFTSFILTVVFILTNAWNSFGQSSFEVGLVANIHHNKFRNIQTTDYQYGVNYKMTNYNRGYGLELGLQLAYQPKGKIFGITQQFTYVWNKYYHSHFDYDELGIDTNIRSLQYSITPNLIFNDRWHTELGLAVYYILNPQTFEPVSNLHAEGQEMPRWQYGFVQRLYFSVIPQLSVGIYGEYRLIPTFKRDIIIHDIYDFNPETTYLYIGKATFTKFNFGISLVCYPFR